MWYKIDSITHPMFQKFYEFDKSWCDIERTVKYTNETWDKAFKADNPITVHYYIDENWEFFWVIKYIPYYNGWRIVLHSYRVVNNLGEFNIAKESPAMNNLLYHILGAFIYDLLTNEDIDKISYNDRFEPSFNDQILSDWQRISWIKEKNTYDAGEDIAVYDTYGIKTTKYIDSEGKHLISFELA